MVLKNKQVPEVNIKPFGTTKSGEKVFLYTLDNGQGLKVEITNYGGIVVRLFTRDKKGSFADIVLGYDRLEDYFNNYAYFGALIGRYGNRINNGSFTLEGKTYQLPKNEVQETGSNHIHGGEKGFDKVVWDAELFKEDNCPGLKLKYFSEEGEQGYPGNLQVQVKYIVLKDNTLRIEYRVETDQKTPINLTNHSYFNLRGEGQSDILNHILQLKASSFTPIDEAFIPTGEIRSVDNTPFDFREPKKIGAEIAANNRQLNIAGGYDHNFIIDGEEEKELKDLGEVYEPETGRMMTVRTTEPGVQFYTGNSLSGQEGKEGSTYKKHTGFCLETQHFPDSPNHDNFPGTFLKPGEEYYSVTEYSFGHKS